MSKRSIDLVSPPRTKKKVYERVANLSLNASLNLSAQPVQPVEHRVAQRVAQPVAQRVTQPVQRVVVAQPVQPRPAFKIIGLARSFLKSCSSDVTCYSPELLSWTLEEGQLKGIWTIDGAQGSTHQMVVKAPSAGIRSLVDIRAHCSCDYSSVYAVYCKHIRLCLEQLLDPDYLELSNDDEGRWYERHPDTLDPVVHAAFQSKRDAIEFVYELIDKSSSEFEREGDRWLQSTCDDFQEEIEVVEVPYFLKTRQDLQNFEEGSFEENFVSSSSSSISN